MDKNNNTDYEKVSWNDLTEIEKKNCFKYSNGIITFSEESIKQMKKDNEMGTAYDLKIGMYDNNPNLQEILKKYKYLLTEEEIDEIEKRADKKYIKRYRLF